MSAPVCPECGHDELVAIAEWAAAPLLTLTFDDIEVDMTAVQFDGFERIRCTNCGNTGWDEFITGDDQ